MSVPAGARAQSESVRLSHCNGCSASRLGQMTRAGTTMTVMESESLGRAPARALERS
jgi:hypothetical protein